MSAQLENGYTKIANEIIDALCKFRIPGEQRQCLDFIFRKTYGFNKKKDSISNSQFCEGTGLLKGNVHRALKELLRKKVVIKTDNGKYSTYQFNKNFESWKVLSKKQPVIKKATRVIKSDTKLLSKMRDTKETITKETITKDKKKLDFQKPNWISENEWSDIIESRKAKKILNTKAALTPFVNQLKIAGDKGFSVRDCLDEFISSRWTRFKAEWMKKEKSTTRYQPRTLADQRELENDEIAKRLNEEYEAKNNPGSDQSSHGLLEN